MKLLFLATAMLFADFSFAQNLSGPVYPGSKELKSKSIATHITNDSYEQVKRFYRNDLGAMPASEEVIENGEKCYFVYYRYEPVHHKGDPSNHGVIVYKMGTTNPNVKKVFSIVSTRRDQNIITTDEYNRIVSQYGHLMHNYYPEIFSQEKNKYVCVTADIFKKYNEISKERHQEHEEGIEDFSVKMQELMEQGRIEEMAALAQNSNKQLASGPLNDIDTWEDCLKELKQHAHQTQIVIQTLPD